MISTANTNESIGSTTSATTNASRINYLDLKENQHSQPRFRPVPMRLNLLKIDMYPDRYSHMKTIRLEYPDDSITTNTSTNTNHTNNNVLNQNTSSNLNTKPNSNGPITSTTTTTTKSNRKPKQRNKLRYMTQPIRLIEIKETEEDLNEINTPTFNDRLKSSTSFENDVKA